MLYPNSEMRSISIYSAVSGTGVNNDLTVTIDCDNWNLDYYPKAVMNELQHSTWKLQLFFVGMRSVDKFFNVFRVWNILKC